MLEQGRTAGTFGTGPSAETARVLVYQLQGFQDSAVEQFIGRQTGTVSFDAVRLSMATLTETIERILGVPAGSPALMGEQTLSFWFA